MVVVHFDKPPPKAGSYKGFGRVECDIFYVGTGTRRSTDFGF